MAMAPGLDTGPVLLARMLPISAEHTSGTLLDDLAQLGVIALIDSLENINTLLTVATPQDDSEATYAHKIAKQEGALDWSAAAPVLARRVRAFHPSPGCYTHLGGDRLKVLSAHAIDEPHQSRSGEIVAADERGIWVACGEGQLVITEAQLPGAKAQSVNTLLRGHQARFQTGQRLGDASHD
jgi:methionyl-tRNA formyltransferase